MCLMAVTGGSTKESSGSTSAADADKVKDCDSSVYQVKDFVNLSLNEKIKDFEYLCVCLENSNFNRHHLTLENEKLKNQLKNKDLDYSKLKIECRDLILSNKLIFEEKQAAENVTKNIQMIIKNWTHSHKKVSKLINDQISFQATKILGGDFESAVKIFKKVETESAFRSKEELIEDFKNKFVPLGFQKETELIEKHCSINKEGDINIQTKISAIDPSLKGSEQENVGVSTENLIKFPMSDGEFHTVTNIACEAPECLTSAAASDDSKKKCTFSKEVNKFRFSKTKKSKPIRPITDVVIHLI
ncbi:hypothetical protein L2E82_17099 [Cichorium intybus]|uniref:Uncharacterized protein n=1 Tax=Cichorium intybus TaxID=13427 RepID=A0ACB9F6P7_CICIN|nr:hypothetical protein L2E82_17099 [Cichorium intybus]